MNKYSYPAEKLSGARRSLMAPHPGGVAESYVFAFQECGPRISRSDRESL